MGPKADVLQGTLDLLILGTLDTLGPRHGYGITRRIRQVSEEALRLNQGSLYPALARLEDRGWIRGRWQTTPQNRRSKVYARSDVGLSSRATMTLTTRDEARRLRGLRVSPAILTMLGAQPFLGRIFERDEALAGRAAVIILGYETWLRAFAGGATVLGPQRSGSLLACIEI